MIPSIAIRYKNVTVLPSTVKYARGRIEPANPAPVKPLTPDSGASSLWMSLIN